MERKKYFAIKDRCRLISKNKGETKDKCKAMANKVKVFLKRKKTMLIFIIGILIFPIIVNWIMTFSVGDFRVEGDEKTWIQFLGSLGGGILTLAGVFLTLRHSQKEKKLEDIKKITVELITSLHTSNIVLLTQRLVRQNLSELENNIHLARFELSKYNQRLNFNIEKMELITFKFRQWDEFKEVFTKYTQNIGQIITPIVTIYLDNLQQIIDKQEKMYGIEKRKHVLEQLLRNYNEKNNVEKLSEYDSREFMEYTNQYNDLNEEHCKLKQELTDIQDIITEIFLKIQAALTNLANFENENRGNIIKLSKTMIEDIDKQLI